MKKRMLLLFFVLMTSTSVSATTWVSLKPQKVLEQAEVIVLGTYNFSSEAKNGWVFNGFEFDVRENILGEYVEPLIAGIDVHDVSWAAEFQEEGGEFLLFLERNEIAANFLVPVGGINGVLKFSEGEIIHPDKKKKAYFEKYLRAQPQSESLGVVDSGYQWEVKSLISIGIFFLLVISLLTFYTKKRRSL